MARINNFKTAMAGGGARSNQFRVTLSPPRGLTLVNTSQVKNEANFLCKAAQLPGLTIENIPVQYRGRTVNFAGEKSFAPWTVSIYNDTNFGIRNFMEDWSRRIQANDSTTGAVNPGDYQAQLQVEQLGRNEEVLKIVTFYDAYPTEIGAIGLDFDTPSIELFDVTFTYNFWTSNTGAISST